MFAYLRTLPNLERLIHGAKTALACLIGLFAAKALNFPVDQWLIITIFVVMCAQLNVGSMLQKSYSRLLGTLSGSIVAALTLFFFPHDPLINALVIAACGAVFSYVATSESAFSDAGTLGAVTVTTILIAQHPTVHIALERFIEISIGILIAAFVSQFIFPVQAKSHLRRTQAKTILLIRNYMRATLVSEPTEETIAHYRYIDEEIVKALSSQRNLAKQSRRELFGAKFSPELFSRLLRCEKDLFRSMICMHYAIKTMPSGRLTLMALPEVNVFNQSVQAALEKIAPCFTNQSISHSVVTIPSLNPLKQALMMSRSQISEDDAIYIDGFLFGAELLIIQLVELVVIIGKSRE